MEIPYKTFSTEHAAQLATTHNTCFCINIRGWVGGGILL